MKKIDQQVRSKLGTIQKLNKVNIMEFNAMVAKQSLLQDIGTTVQLVESICVHNVIQFIKNHILSCFSNNLVKISTRSSKCQFQESKILKLTMFSHLCKTLNPHLRLNLLRNHSVGMDQNFSKIPIKLLIKDKGSTRLGFYRILVTLIGLQEVRLK